MLMSHVLVQKNPEISCVRVCVSIASNKWSGAFAHGIGPPRGNGMLYDGSSTYLSCIMSYIVRLCWKHTAETVESESAHAGLVVIPPAFFPQRCQVQAVPGHMPILSSHH